MFINQISVFIENKKGRLEEITRVLTKAKVNIRAFSIADTTDFGILRLIVDDPLKAEKILKENDIMVANTKVVAVELNDKPGAMHEVIRIISENGMSIEYAYAFTTPRNNKAIVILRIEDTEESIRLLKEKGVPLITAEEAYSL